jgi:hypothetical protein
LVFNDFNLGVVWAVWYLPLFFFGGTNQHDVVGFLTLRTDAFFYAIVLWVFVVHITLIWGAKIQHPTLKSPRQKTRNAVNDRDSPVSASMVSIRRRASVTSTPIRPWTLLRRAAARV